MEGPTPYSARTPPVVDCCDLHYHVSRHARSSRPSARMAVAVRLTFPHKLQGEAREGQSPHKPSAEAWQLHAVVRRRHSQAGWRQRSGHRQRTRISMMKHVPRPMPRQPNNEKHRDRSKWVRCGGSVQPPRPGSWRYPRMRGRKPRFRHGRYTIVVWQANASVM